METQRNKRGQNPGAEAKKIVYLFGAGATHAELKNLEPDLLDEKRGLLIRDVSSRVIDKARKNRKYLKDVNVVSGTSGSLNIELLISLIENSKIHGWADKTALLKELVEKDIKSILTAPQTRRFYLHKTLFELHEHKKTKKKEKLIGLISLNYDDVLDRAYKAMLGRDPDYCLSLDGDSFSSKSIPLLKLHGSFNWENQRIHGNTRTIEIIPLGSSKSYLHVPYSFIWNRALDILIKCDSLRVIGCSLSPNDIHLIDLLFKAHLERSKAIEIEIIDRDEAGKQIRDNYGFFPSVTILSKLKEPLIPDSAPDNPFKTWLKYHSIAMVGEEQIKRTRYLKKVVS
jgi:hypothetical protein